MEEKVSKIEVYLIRHGKTYCNENHLYCGKSDVELSENGINELNLKVRTIKYPTCEVYFTSGARRTIETLNIIKPNVQNFKSPKLFEYDFGDFELKSYEELKGVNEYINWIMDKTGAIKCPNGENKIQFKARVLEGFKELVEFFKKEKIKNALGVVHGGSIGLLLEELYDNSKNFYEWQPQPGEGYKLTINIKSNKIEKITAFK